MKKRLPNILLCLILGVGISLLLYPTFSDYWNARHQSKAVDGYVEAVKKLDKKSYKKTWKRAREYNKRLFEAGRTTEGLSTLSDAQRKEYESQLNVSGTGVMAYVEIPTINCRLPVYHGTEDEVLQTSVGHIEGSSLPVGGKNTHCVLSGHRGLPSARLFTDLDKLTVGDRFMIHTLNKTLTYEVDQILIVLPEETDALRIQEGKDLCTLITCTPYGINTHRLLVRGHRVPNSSSAQVTADAVQIEPITIAPIFAVPLLLVLLIGMLVRTKRNKKH